MIGEQASREAESHLKSRGYSLDWLAFADAWRAQYQPGMEEVRRSGRIPFSKLDVLHRRMLDRLLPQVGVKDLPEDVTQSLNLAWHRLDAWPDVKPGFVRLTNNFLLPVSNGNISLMSDLARRNQLRFDPPFLVPRLLAITNRNRESISPPPKPSIFRPQSV